MTPSEGAGAGLEPGARHDRSTSHVEPGQPGSPSPPAASAPVGHPRLRRVGALLATAGRFVRTRAATSLRWLAHWWRVSLQFRVVTTTMLLGLVVMVLLQTFLYQRVSAGLVDSRIASAREDSAHRARDMQAKLDATDRIDAESVRVFTLDLIRQQESQTPDQAREVIITRSLNNTRGPQRLPTMWTDVDASVIPMALRQAVVADPSHQQVQIVTIPRGDGTVPAIFVGSLLTVPQAGQEELYFIFPLDREEGILTMMQRTFVLGSIVLVVLIGLIAYVVTRLVVDPVREAAEVAERLSSGRLNERMRVKGEDDLAKLAGSFNGMADGLQTQIRQLEDLSRVQQRFVSDVSHELRTPLTTIRMAADVIYDARPDFAAPVARSTELLHGQVERFEELLGELLEISRFDAGGAVPETERLDLRDIVNRVVAGVAPLADQKGCQVVLLGGEQEQLCDMDPRRVERIVRNLVVNALEHAEGRPVHVELGGNEDAVGVAVRDFGVGLEPGQAAMVFNRFWRADPARKRTTGGTGLGLAISLEDAKLHSGWLQAWGRPGAGARFRLTLPRYAGRPIVRAPLPLSEVVDDVEPVASHPSPGRGSGAASGPGAGPGGDLPR